MAGTSEDRTDQVRFDMPDPDRAADLPEFIGLLEQLRIWAGRPSYRTLAKRVGPLLVPPQEVSASTVIDVFKVRRRRLNHDLVTAIVRALGLDGDAVERWDAACFRVHAEARTGGPTGVHRQLPADLATFTGRTDQLTRLVTAASRADGRQTIVISAIEGMAGVGKTRLAIRAAYELIRSGRYTDAQLYADLHGFDPDRPPAEPSTILAGFLRQLEVPAQRIPDSLDERAAMFRDRMAGREALVLLDNAADEKQVSALLPADPGCLVLITSRRSLMGLDGATALLLDVFEPAEALELLARIAGRERVEAEPESASAVVEACGRLPLAVALAATRLRSRPSWGVTDLARRLSDGVLALGGSGNHSLRAVFDLSYRGLPPEARRVFRLLGAHPGPDLTAAAVAALADLDVVQAEDVLELLQDEHLVQQNTAGRYVLHDLLRAYAADLVRTESPGEGPEAVRRLVVWYTLAADAAAQSIMPSRYTMPLDPAAAERYEVRFFDSARATAWFEAEKLNLDAAVEAAAAARRDEDGATRPSFGYLTWRLAAVMATYLGLICDWHRWDRLHRLGLTATVETGDLVGEAWIRSNLSICEAELGRFDEAVEHLTRALEIRRVLGDESGQAAVLSNLTRTYAYAGKLELGLQFARQSLDLTRRTGDRGRESAALNNIACVLNELGRLREALEYFQQKLEIDRASRDPRGIGLALHNIGDSHMRLDEYAESAAAFREALDTAIGFGDRHGEGGALFGLATALEAQGRIDEARTCLEQALSIFDALGTPEAAAVRERLRAIRQTDPTPPDAGAAPGA